MVCLGENFTSESVGMGLTSNSEGAALGDIRWHFAVHLQSNKVKLVLAVVPNLDMVESGAS